MAEAQGGGSGEGKKRSSRGVWIWTAALLLIAIGIFFFFHGRSKGAAKAQADKPGARPGAGGPVMVDVATSQKGDIGVYVGALGLVTPLNTVAVRSRVEGQLIETHYREGGMVMEGDPLAEIDPAPYQAALSQAEGQLARDQALLENARLDFKRYQDAFARNAVPKQQLDTQQSAVRQFEGAVKLDQGQVENARVQLNYCHIRAPITGRVGLRLVDAGNIVRANDTNPLVVITQLKPINVVFSVAEDYLPQIQKQVKAGNRLPVEALDRAQEKRIATGTLQTVDNQIDVGTGTVKLKAEFANDDESLFPNQFVNARLLIETHHNVTTVPNHAIQRGSQGAFVFVVKADETVEARPVKIGASDPNVTEAGDLEPGVRIAVNNFNRLNNGSKVTVRPSQGGGSRTNTAGASGQRGRRGGG